MQVVVHLIEPKFYFIITKIPTHRQLPRTSFTVSRIKSKEQCCCKLFLFTSFSSKLLLNKDLRTCCNNMIGIIFVFTDVYEVSRFPFTTSNKKLIKAPNYIETLNRIDPSETNIGFCSFNSRCYSSIRIK